MNYKLHNSKPSLMFTYFKLLFTETWKNAEIESEQKNTSSQAHFIDFRVITILVYIAVGLSVVKYYGNADSILVMLDLKNPSAFSSWFCSTFYSPACGELYKKLYWVSVIILFYLVIPVVIVKLGFRQSLKDYGFSFRNIHKDYPLYVLLLTVMLPIVFFASATPAFQARYPLYHPGNGQFFPYFILWQFAYFIQFIAVEFFFRGFILHGTRNRFGLYAVFVSMIPYCMVHFGKPFGETIAAIFAGVVLGTLSLKSRSVILGVLIHYSVAITMDLMALYRIGFFNFK